MIVIFQDEYDKYYIQDESDAKLRMINNKDIMLMHLRYN